MSRTLEPPSTADDSTRVPQSSPDVRSPSSTPAKPADNTGDGQSVLGLNSGDRRVTVVLVCVALVLMSVHWYRLTQQRPQPIEVIRPEGYQFRLDVNGASWVEWMQLDRIGEMLARRIVEDREQNGPFASVDDVERVPGIGPKTMDAVRGHLTCRPPAETNGGFTTDHTDGY